MADQGALYPRFAAVVLLTAPWPVIETRLRTRTTNDFGKDPVELTRIRRDLAEVEPLLRVGADHIVDTAGPLAHVVDAVERIVRSC